MGLRNVSVSPQSHKKTWSHLSCSPTVTKLILLTTSSPEAIRPKIVCFPLVVNDIRIKCNIPSRNGRGARVIKNWLPFVLGPLFAIDTMPAPVCLSSRVISSSKGFLKPVNTYATGQFIHSTRKLIALLCQYRLDLHPESENPGNTWKSERIM